MKKKTIGVIVVILIIIVVLFILFNTQGSRYSKIGVVLPLSGPASFIGEDYRRGMEFAANEYGVDIAFQDGKASPTDSLNAALQLYNSGSNVIITALRGASLSIASSFSDKNDILIFATTATSDRAPIGDFGNNFFAIGAEMISNGTEAGKNATLSCSSAVTLTEQSDAGLDKVAGFTNALGSEKILLSEEFAPDKSDFRDLITKTKQYNPDCIFIEVKSNFFVTFMNQLINSGLNSKIYTTSYSVNKDVIQNLSDEQKALITFSSTTINPDSAFSKKYFDTYQRYPNDFSLIGYEMIKLIAMNERVCKEENYIECLTDNLNSLDNMESSVGNLTIDTNQEIKLRNNTLYTISGIDFVEVK